jgi:hypothetical protein
MDGCFTVFKTSLENSRVTIGIVTGTIIAVMVNIISLKIDIERVTCRWVVESKVKKVGKKSKNQKNPKEFQKIPKKSKKNPKNPKKI